MTDVFVPGVEVEVTELLAFLLVTNDDHPPRLSVTSRRCESRGIENLDDDVVGNSVVGNFSNSASSAKGRNQIQGDTLGRRTRLQCLGLRVATL